MRSLQVLRLGFAVYWLNCYLGIGSAQQATPIDGGQVNSPIVVINNGPGNQTDPHVNGNLASYTDGGTRIHYFNFSTDGDLPIPQAPGAQDTLSDVNGTRIAFSRTQPDFSTAAFLFDTGTSSLTEIDPQPGTLRFNPVLGGNTLAYVDLNVGNGDIYVYDLAANPLIPPQDLSASAISDDSPAVSPDGNTIVWEKCVGANCDILKALRTGGVWNVSNVVNTAFNEENPDTDGTWIVYDSNRTGNSQIYFQPVAGGAETQLSIPGDAINPSISKGVITFEDRSGGPGDIFAYVIATNTLYQVTSTPNIDDTLNDVGVLPNGDIRVVWSSQESDNNVYATTFTPAGIHYEICPLYDSSMAKKSGSAYPIKIQLCDANGDNMSSPSIVVHAVGVTRTSTNAPMVLDDTGNANPDFDFRYDASLNGYIFNLSTKGYSTGTYNLNFTAGADPATHSATFGVK